MKSPKEPSAGDTRQEVDQLVAKIREKVAASPQKAAKILSEWVERPRGSRKKTAQREEKKRVA